MQHNFHRVLANCFCDCIDIFLNSENVALNVFNRSFKSFNSLVFALKCSPINLSNS